MRDAGVGGEADDGESLRGGDLRREDGGGAAAELAQALGGRRRRILIVLQQNIIFKSYRSYAPKK